MITRSSRWAGALLVSLAGCGTPVLEGGLGCQTGSCPDADTPDAGCDSPCAVGKVVHWGALWATPSWVWIGPEAQAPDCPQGTMSIAYEGRTDLVAPPACEACTCEPPTGSCALPSQFTASKFVCSKPGDPTTTTSFDAPVPWDGQCDSTTQVPSGGANSLTIDPLTMTENGCASGPPVPAQRISLHWDTFARACDVNLPVGPVDRSVCISHDPPAPGFALCVFRDGEHACPPEPGNAFTEQHIFYQGVQDDRQCSACTCGPPIGSLCTATISIYTDAKLSCNGPPFVPQFPISSEKPVCLDLAPSGQALGSKSAGSMAYLPGTCPAMGGDASGRAIPTEPTTLCCRP